MNVSKEPVFSAKKRHYLQPNVEICALKEDVIRTSGQVRWNDWGNFTQNRENTFIGNSFGNN